MRTDRRGGGFDELAAIDGDVPRVLSAREERELLRELGACKDALHAGRPVAEPGGAVARRYQALRGRLAMANLRLVAHVARRYRDRGIAAADLIQEGFCGLLEAIDRFDLARETKLATYATWWIRQAMQRAVAAGAYPVRLSPRHLRQLARHRDGPTPAAAGSPEVPSDELIARIATATRPATALDAAVADDGRFHRAHALSDPGGDGAGAIDTEEVIGRLMAALRPREREVLALRFGLGGRPRLSLSQAGRVLAVSKERVRQIESRALKKLREVAEELSLCEGLVDV